MKILLALATIVLGCGDNLHPAAEAPDAAPPDTGFSEASHADPPQVVSGGGPILATPKIIPVFFASDSAAQPTIEAFLGQLADSPYWHAVVGEYGVGALTIAPSIVSTDAPPTTDTALETWLEAQTDGTHQGWPTPDASTLYTIFLPPGVVLTQGGSKSCVAFGGYHSETQNGTVYALIPRCTSPSQGPLDPTTGATSHELVEATTDPHPFTAPAFTRMDPNHYIWNRTPGAELGDMCEYVQTAFQPLLGSFVVQRTWSNASAAAGHDPCVPVLDTPYLGAAPNFTETLMLPTRTGTLTTQGVTVNAGTSKTIEVDLFSDAPSDAYSVEAIDAGEITGSTVSLAFQWDRTSGQNGDKLNLMVTRTKSLTTSRGSEFVIRVRDKDNKIVSLWWGLAAGM